MKRTDIVAISMHICPLLVLSGTSHLCSEIATLLRRNKHHVSNDRFTQCQILFKSHFSSMGFWKHIQNRPAYQRNDYVGWITRAKQQATREKRLKHMLDGLATGYRYRNMAYTAKQDTE